LSHKQKGVLARQKRYHEQIGNAKWGKPNVIGDSVRTLEWFITLNLFDVAELVVVRISFICSALYSWLRIASLGGFE
jgi:hypothetical protein